MDLQQISLKLQAGKARDVKALVQQAIDEGIPAHEILEKGLVAGMNVIGEKFKNNEVFVPEVLVAARAMNMGASLLKPLLAAEGVKATGKVCIGTVKGDLPDIGKNLVKMMLEEMCIRDRSRPHGCECAECRSWRTAAPPGPPVPARPAGSAFPCAGPSIQCLRTAFRTDSTPDHPP